jgi:hypothetical protein
MEPSDEHRPTWRDREQDETSRAREPSLGAIVEKAVRGLITAVVLAAGIVGLALYSRPGPPRYEAVVVDGQVIRVDTRTGTMIACEGGHCLFILRQGQHLERASTRGPAPKQEAAPAQVAPAPARALPAPANRTGG